MSSSGAKNLWTSDAWRRLALRRPAPIAELFAHDPERAERYTLAVGDLVVDVSKQSWDDETRRLLDSLAVDCDLAGAFAAMAAGQIVNPTESRAAGHVALRSDHSFVVDGVDQAPLVAAARREMFDFVDGVHAGRVTAADGDRFTDVVNVGIGGSDLGPRLADSALRAFRHGAIRCHFVSNVDPAESDEVLRTLDPRRTLVVVSSKTMTTEETLANQAAIRAWLERAVGAKGVGAHVVGVTADVERARSIGIDRNFRYWNWVGGRFSLASSVGLTTALGVGTENFTSVLAGMRTVDEHTASTPVGRNVPVQLALLGAWNRGVLGATSRAVVPYAHDLRLLPAYLQQLEMESNGKSTSIDGTPVGGPTGPVVWGGAGTDGQHAYFQFLHQGSDVVPVDFIGFARSSRGDDGRHAVLVANLIAQSRALAFGRPDDPSLEWSAHRRFAGGRPNTVIVAPRLTPSTFGQIVALYEHATFFLGRLWGVNSFDQWGVELGKDVARRIVAGDRSAFDDPSSARLVEWIRRQSESADE